MRDARREHSLFRKKWGRGSSRDDSEEVVPPPDDAAGVSLDELLERDAHLLLHGAGRVDVARDVVELGALVARAPERREPCAAATAD